MGHSLSWAAKILSPTQDISCIITRIFFAIVKLDVCGSVHHSTIHKEEI